MCLVSTYKVCRNSTVRDLVCDHHTNTAVRFMFMSVAFLWQITQNCEVFFFLNTSCAEQNIHEVESGLIQLLVLRQTRAKRPGDGTECLSAWISVQWIRSSATSWTFGSVASSMKILSRLHVQCVKIMTTRVVHRA